MMWSAVGPEHEAPERHCTSSLGTQLFCVSLALCGRPPWVLCVQVHGVTKFCVFCTVTDLSDLEAIILKEDISSSEITDPSDRVRRGDTVNARWAAPHV